MATSVHSSHHVNDADLFQIALLVDQLRHDDVHHRVNAIKSITSIASALGTERTRDELISFLAESMDDEQEVLLEIAEKLGELIKYVGGREYVHLILIPLETLIMNEQINIRDAAVLSAEICADNMPAEHLMMYFVPFVTRFAKKDIYLARISATYLLSSAYSKPIPESTKAEFSALFLSLCNDPTPLVRRSAAINFPKMIKVVNPMQLVTDYILAFNSFASHEQESIRIQSIAICIALGEALPVENKANKVLPVVLALSRDKSWRVRYTFVTRLHEIVSRIPAADVAITAAFDALLNDTEAEVRGAAATNIAQVCQYLSKDQIFSKLMSSIQRLTIDTSESVRINAAGGLGQIVNILTREETVEYILPMLLGLLRDEVAEVRLSVITKLDALHDMLGADMLSHSLLPAISNLAVDSKWRVRLAIIEHVPLLLTQMSAPFFRDKLSDICLSWLADSVSAVRSAAVDNLPLLYSRLGEGWVTSAVMPRLDILVSHKNYLLRLTGLHTIRVLCQILASLSVEKILIQKVFHLAKDPVANVRMNTAPTLLTVYNALALSSPNRKMILEYLAELNEDSDRDVRFSSAVALLELTQAERR